MTDFVSCNSREGPASKREWRKRPALVFAGGLGGWGDEKMVARDGSDC